MQKIDLWHSFPTRAGIGMEIAYFVLPQLFPNTPKWVLWILFLFGIFLITYDFIIFFIKARKKTMEYLIGIIFIAVGIGIIVNAYLNSKSNNLTLSKNGIEIYISGNWLSLNGFDPKVRCSENTISINEQQWRIAQFYLEGRNNNDVKIKKASGHIESNHRNKEIELLIDNGVDNENKQVNIIPAKSKFRVRAIFPNSTPDAEGWMIKDFWNEFGPFKFTMNFDDTMITKVFSKREIEKFLDDYFRRDWCNEEGTNT